MLIRDKMLSFRSSEDLRKQLADLRNLTGSSQADVIHEAVEKLWREYIEAKAA